LRGLGFYGGVAWGIRPCPYYRYLDDVTMHWWFVPEFDVRFYRAWYGPGLAVALYPAERFRWAGFFYPTTANRDLAITVSTYPPDRQSAFRLGLDRLTDRVVKELSNGLGVATTVSLDPLERPNVGPESIAVTHFDAISSPDSEPGAVRGIAVEGVVYFRDRGLGWGLKQAYSYRGVIDLEDYNRTIAFVATNPLAPTSREIGSLQRVNGLIAELSTPRGQPLVAYVPPEAPAAPGVITVEPEPEPAAQ
jgi:hypothetical protein